jgi:hypothetical protein
MNRNFSQFSEFFRFNCNSVDFIHFQMNFSITFGWKHMIHCCINIIVFLIVTIVWLFLKSYRSCPTGIIGFVVFTIYIHEIFFNTFKIICETWLFDRLLFSQSETFMWSCFFIFLKYFENQTVFPLFFFSKKNGSLNTKKNTLLVRCSIFFRVKYFLYCLEFKHFVVFRKKKSSFTNYNEMLFFLYSF